ncbi:MAG: hypothetical protein V2I33_20075, partial [Kangiellaceae bacterium]|nr:hypothetical protein [Kangiellaceae bacterium]
MVNTFDAVASGWAVAAVAAHAVAGAHVVGADVTAGTGPEVVADALTGGCHMGVIGTDRAVIVGRSTAVPAAAVAHTNVDLTCRPGPHWVA